MCTHIIRGLCEPFKKCVYICSVQLCVVLFIWVKNDGHYPLSLSAGSSKIKIWTSSPIVISHDPAENERGNVRDLDPGRVNCQNLRGRAARARCMNFCFRKFTKSHARAARVFCASFLLFNSTVVLVHLLSRSRSTAAMCVHFLCYRTVYSNMQLSIEFEIELLLEYNSMIILY